MAEYSKYTTCQLVSHCPENPGLVQLLDFTSNLTLICVRIMTGEDVARNGQARIGLQTSIARHQRHYLCNAEARSLASLKQKVTYQDVPW